MSMRVLINIIQISVSVYDRGSKLPTTWALTTAAAFFLSFFRLSMLALAVKWPWRHCS